MVSVISLLGQHFYLTFKQREFQIDHFNIVCVNPQQTPHAHATAYHVACVASPSTHSPGQQRRSPDPRRPTSATRIGIFSKEVSITRIRLENVPRDQQRRKGASPISRQEGKDPGEDVAGSQHETQQPSPRLSNHETLSYICGTSSTVHICDWIALRSQRNICLRRSDEIFTVRRTSVSRRI